MKGMRTIAIVLAAGVGQRFNGPVPKQFLKLGRRPVFAHALDPFLRHGKVDEVYLVLNPGYDLPVSDGVRKIFSGGKSRLSSLWNSLATIDGLADDRLLIHDGVRPFPSLALIDRVLAALDSADGIAPILPIYDSIVCPNSLDLMDRSQFALVQTPQAFRRGALVEAMERSDRITTGFCEFEILRKFTPEAKLKLVQGERRNLKITTVEDFEMARALARRI